MHRFYRSLGLSVLPLLVVFPAWAQPAPAAPAPAPLPPPAAEPVPAPPPPPAAVPAVPPPGDAALPAAPAAPVTPAAPAAPPAPPEPAAEEGPRTADRLEVGKNEGFFQPSALLQFWAFYQDEAETTTTFRIRRAEIRVKGDIVPETVAYNIMVDPAKLMFRTTEIEVGDPPEPVPVAQLAGSDQSILQDFFITFPTEYVDVSVGQYKNPVSLEGYTGSSKVIFPERSLVSRAFGDRRDLGLRLEKKIGKSFYYYAGLFNGTGQNRLDDDNEKDGALRLEVYPIEGLTLAALGYATIGERDGTVRDRLEGDVRYDAHDVLLQAEYIHGWDGPGGESVEGHGAYGVLGYTFIDRIQPVVRVGFLDENVDAEDDAVTHYEAGINYYLRGQEARVALTGGAFDPQSGDTLYTATLFAQVSF